jgi:ADP-ribosylglycohydrolase
MSQPSDHEVRLRRARLSLDGLSVGDAFGECFFANPATVERRIAARATAPAPWRYTDDTVMALAIVEILEEHGTLHQEALAARFARKYGLDPDRGYGGMAHRILADLARGLDWRDVAAAAFAGMGSMGNGGAMRAGPIGAYYADDFAVTVHQARRSAEVTHAHREGQAGAIAVAVAAAWAARRGRAENLFTVVLDHVPAGETRDGIVRAAALSRECDVHTAASVLGNGAQVIAPDTVPFALWCAARHLRNYEEALWTTVAGLGDRDTTCAIVGGIVALVAPVPPAWLAQREPLA